MHREQLMKHYIYLAGPIAGQTYGGATNWRDLVSVVLNSDKVECLSPMRGKAFLKDATVISSGGYQHLAMSSREGHQSSRSLRLHSGSRIVRELP